jgi:hypothetical protein
MIVLGPRTGACLYCDCNRDRAVTIDELLNGVNILLGSADVAVCEPFDRNEDGHVSVDELRSLPSATSRTAAGRRRSSSPLTSPPARSAPSARPAESADGIEPTTPWSAPMAGWYVVNRLFADNIRCSIRRRICNATAVPTGSATNPHDIASVDDHKACHAPGSSRSADRQLPAQPNCSDFTIGSINLSCLPTTTTTPTWMAIVDGRLYVALERLDINRILRPRNGIWR